MQNNRDKTFELKLELETVTPLFLGGVDPRGEPELRAPSIRGALRFWFRSLLGGTLGDQSKEIFSRESEVFGNIDHASSVVVQVSHQDLPRIGYNQLSQNKPGIVYLFFSARRIQYWPERKAIECGSKLTCVLRLRAGVRDSKVLQAATAALWLLTHFGGLGMRSRRGGGNLQVVSHDRTDCSLPHLTVQAKTAEQLQKELREGLNKLRNWAAKTFNVQQSHSFKTSPSFEVLHPDWCKIFVVNYEFTNWEEALNKFGQAMQQFRKRRKPTTKM